MRRCILGIDPGAHGAIALMLDGRLVEVIDMPSYQVQVGKGLRTRINEDALDAEIGRLLAEHATPLDDIRAVVEDVGPTPRDGSRQAFNFGTAWGLVRGVLAGRRIPREYVTPQTWKRGLRLKRAKDDARKRATDLFPSHRDQFARVADDGRAEAALIAHWTHIRAQ